MADIMMTEIEYQADEIFTSEDKILISNEENSSTISNETTATAKLEQPDELVIDHILRDEVSFIHNVSQFYNQEALSDIILRVNDSTFFAHKFVLAKSSDVFRTMLYERNWSQGPKTEIELEETMECQTVFDRFLRYLYQAEVVINDSVAVGILCLADKYNVVSLKELCCKYMIQQSKSPHVRNALNWYSWSKLLQLDGLNKQCSKTIAWNFNEILHSPEWLSMDLEFLGDFLKSSELIVQNENAIWESVMTWLLHECRQQQLVENAATLFPLIRFPQMLVSQLYHLEQSELASRSECCEQLHELVSKAYRFRALCLSQALLGVSFMDAFYCTRDYIDLVVDTVRIQNNLRFGIQVDVKTYRGPVPSEIRDADWKLTYRKQNDLWSMQLFCHETALVNNEAHIQVSIIVCNEMEQIIQVHREERRVCTRGSTLTVQLVMEQPEFAKTLTVLIKPVAN